MTDVFISYSRRDSVYVARLAGALRERGKEAWVDTEGLADGEVFPQALRSAIENADAFVPVISPDSTSSVHCGTEVDHAVRLGKRIVPVLLRPVPDEQLPTEIRERNWIPADAGDAADRLVRAVETDLDHVRAHTRWTARAVEWEQSGRDGSLLPRGSDLAAGESWLGSCGTQTDPAPTTAQRELLLTARRAQARRQRRLTTIVAVGLIVSLVLLVFALISRHSAQVARRTADDQRRTATAQALAARSAAAIPVSPRAALELARRAVTVQASATTMRALKQALDAQRLIAAPAAVQTGPSCEDPKPAYSPQSRQLALGSCNGTVRIVDADSGSSIRTLRIGGDASTIAAIAPTGVSWRSWTGGRCGSLIRAPPRSPRSYRFPVTVARADRVRDRHRVQSGRPASCRDHERAAGDPVRRRLPAGENRHAAGRRAWWRGVRPERPTAARGHQTRLRRRRGPALEPRNASSQCSEPGSRSRAGGQP